MLRHTFRHLTGIGEVRERRLWKRGIRTWSDLDTERADQGDLFDPPPSTRTPPLQASRNALAATDAAFFDDRLPSADRVRIAATVPEKTLFVNVETTGSSPYYDEITVVGWDVGGRYGAWVRPDSPQRLMAAIQRAAIIVTFGGSTFDLPFLREAFPTLTIPKCHIDLRYASRHIGCSGAQREIETELGIRRPTGLRVAKEAPASVLWHDYRWGNMSALRQLIDANRADVEGMKGLLDEIIQHRVDEIGPPLSNVARPRFSHNVQTTGSLFPASAESTAVAISPYSGEPGPKVRYDELDVRVDDRVVGIDLTGSEDQPSGWALLDGPHAKTERISSDAELIQATLRAEPSVVSVDAPLSLPAGRTHVEDSDPARDDSGIMRECERTLKRRGVPVYPCLIPSMQALTARGIRLAARLRAHGVQVIECYPGAAQDILRIPRKQAGLSYLRSGLSRFGLEGNVDDKNLSHDELDAITCAVVGLCFRADAVERLGTEDEGFLILPAVKREAANA